MKTIMKAAFGNGTYELNDEGNLELVQDQSNQYPIVIGQIAHFHGYGNERERLAVYKIEKDERWGSTYYHLLNLDKPKLSKHEHLRPLETRKGTPIGIYYKQGDIATQEEIEEVLPMALAYEQREADKRAEAQKKNEQEEEIAKKWWAENTPIGGFQGYDQKFVCDPANVRLKKEITPRAQEGAQPTGDKIALCKLNSAKGGIELYFNNKPAQAVLDDLKAKSWRWSKFNKCWYRLDNPIARQQAAKYADIPQEEVNHDGAMVQAQEEAVFDTFAANNL